MVVRFCLSFDVLAAMFLAVLLVRRSGFALTVSDQRAKFEIPRFRISLCILSYRAGPATLPVCVPMHATAHSKVGYFPITARLWKAPVPIAATVFRFELWTGEVTVQLTCVLGSQTKLLLPT